MPEYGIQVDEQGNVKCGDLANPKVTVTRAQIESWVAGRTLAQVQTQVNGVLNPHNFYCKVLSLDPLEYLISDRPFA